MKNELYRSIVRIYKFSIRLTALEHTVNFTFEHITDFILFVLRQVFLPLKEVVILLLL